MKNQMMITAICLALTATAVAQDRANERKPNFGAGFEYAVPTSEFSENYGNNMIGFGANLSVPFGRKVPIELGADYKFHFMGSDRAQVELTEEITSPEGDVNTLIHDGTLAANSRMHSLHGQLRLKPFNGAVAPYVDGLAGFRMHHASTTLRSDSDDFQLQERANLLPKDSWTLSYGAAVGSTIRLSRSLNLDLKWSYLRGNSGQYIDPGSLEVNPNDLSVDYDLRESKMDMMVFSVGLRF